MISLFPSRTVLVSIFGWSVHWYGFLYLIAFIAAYHLARRLQKYRDMSWSDDRWSSALTAAVLGVIIGGRLGYVFLYEPLYFLSNPLQIFAVWKGGMASHGGFVGVAVALWLYVRGFAASRLDFADVLAVPIAIGLAIGRLGNFINQELYGSPTALPWGITIPGVAEPRHPTQIYSLLANLAIAALCYWYLCRQRPVVAGRVCALFLLLYSVQRFAIEFVRVPTHTTFDFGIFTLTRGQIYSLPVFLAGVLLWLYAKRMADGKYQTLTRA